MGNVLPVRVTDSDVVSTLEGAGLAPLGIINARLNRMRAKFGTVAGGEFFEYRANELRNAPAGETRRILATLLPPTTTVDRVSQFPAEDAGEREFVIQEGATNLPAPGVIRIFVTDLGATFDRSDYANKEHAEGTYNWAVRAVVQGSVTTNYKSALVLLEVATWWVIKSLDGWNIPTDLVNQRYSKLECNAVGPLQSKGSYAQRRFGFSAGVRIGGAEIFREEEEVNERFDFISVEYPDEDQDSNAGGGVSAGTPTP